MFESSLLQLIFKVKYLPVLFLNMLNGTRTKYVHKCMVPVYSKYVQLVASAMMRFFTRDKAPNKTFPKNGHPIFDGPKKRSSMLTKKFIIRAMVPSLHIS